MSHLLNKQEIAAALTELLNRTSLPPEQVARSVNRLFEEFKWEGVPYVEVGKTAYMVTIYERGMPMLKKRLKQTDEVLYWLLADIIFTIAHVELMKRHGVDNVHTYLKYTEAIYAELNADVQKAFQQIGGVYLRWHESGKRQELEQS
ncbi:MULTISPECIES: Imm63 family immunity protein [unclassified Paenibacillus]|uniref:Imm63 family immunity protein n=1 Tax=unclassified Paenibacillus TaxID=185978 RepID=UPI000FE20772|nr:MULTISPECIES: Imm63 family immunity protein [unclassified Paenibacillus]MCM3171644.1 immunity 63 family protein [Paenibacillus sp. MER 99-2]